MWNPLLNKRAINFTKMVAAALAALSFCGCVAKLIPDFAPAPIDVGEGRVETVACGHWAVGNNLCWVRDGNAKKAVVEIHTVFSGTITIIGDGPGCKVNLRSSYSDFETIAVPMTDVGILTQPCVLEIAMSPALPGQDKSEVESRSWAGRVVLIPWDSAKSELGVVLPSEGAELANSDDGLFYPGGVSFVVRGQSSGPIKRLLREKLWVDVGGSSRGSVMVQGCGQKPWLEKYGDEGGFLIRLSEIFGAMPARQNCVLYGRAVRLDKETDVVFAVLLSVISEDALPLAAPKIEVDVGEQKVKISNEDPVSFTVVDGQWERGGNVTMRVSDPKRFVVQQVTSRGRTVVVKYLDGVKRVF